MSKIWIEEVSAPLYNIIMQFNRDEFHAFKWLVTFINNEYTKEKQISGYEEGLIRKINEAICSFEGERNE